MNIEINQSLVFPDYKCIFKTTIHSVLNGKLASSSTKTEYNDLFPSKIRINTNSNNFILMFSFYPSIEALDDNGEVEESYMDEYQDMLFVVVHDGVPYSILEHMCDKLEGLSYKTIIRTYVNSILNDSFDKIIEKYLQVDYSDGMYLRN